MYKKIFVILVLGCVVTAGCNSTRMFSKGDKSMQSGRYNEAISFYDKGLMHSDDYDAYLKKGIAEWRVRDYSNAELSFTDAINTSPNNASLAYYYRAEMEFKAGNVTDALTDVNESIKQDPLYVQALNLRGRIYTMQGEYHAAVGDLSAAITLDEESPVSGYLYHNRAIAYIGMDNFNSARNDCEQYVRFLKKNNLPVTVEENYLLGILQYATDDENEAMTSWRHLPSEEKRKIKRIVGNYNKTL